MQFLQDMLPFEGGDESGPGFTAAHSEAGGGSHAGHQQRQATSSQPQASVATPTVTAGSKGRRLRHQQGASPAMPGPSSGGVAERQLAGRPFQQQLLPSPAAPVAHGTPQQQQQQ